MSSVPVNLVAEVAPPAEVRVKRSGGVLNIVLSNPSRRNALTGQSWEMLHTALTRIDASTDRVVVLRGDGENFSAGGDIRSVPLDDAERRQTMEAVNRASEALVRVGVPTVAVVDGYALGAGMNLAIACDLVIATTRARFGQPFVRRGLTPDGGGTWLLPRMVGMQRAKEMVLLGEMFDAARAFEIGLVSRCVDAAALDDTVKSVVEMLLGNAPLAVARAKRLLDSADNSLTDALAAEMESQMANLDTVDHAEAVAAFAEGRAPRFVGR